MRRTASSHNQYAFRIAALVGAQAVDSECRPPHNRLPVAKSCVLEFSCIIWPLKAHSLWQYLVILEFRYISCFRLPTLSFLLSFSVSSSSFFKSMFISAVVLVLYSFPFSLFLSEFFYCVLQVIFLSLCRCYVFHCFVHSYLFAYLRILLTTAHFRALDSKMELLPTTGFTAAELSTTFLRP